MGTTSTLLLLACGLSVGGLAAPADLLTNGTRFYVCPHPPLSGPSEEWHRTAKSALDAVLAARLNGDTGTIVVELCEGVHPHTTPLTITPAHTHRGGITAIIGEGTGATLEGGLPVTGWAPAKVNKHIEVLAGTIPRGHDSRQLWVNGARATRAHAAPTECSGGPVDPTVPCPPLITGAYGPSGYTGVPPNATIGGVKIGAWLAGTEFVYGRGASGASWTEPRCTVANVTPTSAAPETGLNVTVEAVCWQLARGKAGQSVKYPSDVENALELLDSPGEWYADFDVGIVYYAPRPGESAASLSAILGSAVEPPSVNGKYSNSVAAITVLPGSQRLHFEGLAFQHFTWLGPSGEGGFVDLQSAFYYVMGAAGKHLVGVPGALTLHGARNVSVDRCNFTHLGLSAIVADGQGLTVTGSNFNDLSGSAITLGNVSDPVATPPMQDCDYTISGNTIAFTGQEYRGSAGVFAGYVATTQIVRNAISDTSNGAVCIGWGWGANNTMRSNNVSFNHITRSNTVLYDCGSIYTLSAQPGSEISYNYLENQVLLFGSLYHDARSSGFHTHHNVVVGGPMWLYLQWGSLGAVNHITIDNNYHNQSVAGGCATPKEAPTCQATGFCPQHYPPSTCGGLLIQNNVLVNGTAWPQAALDIEGGAGP